MSLNEGSQGSSATNVAPLDASPNAPKRTATSVSRRIVFYVPGFDPKGAARYRALYRHEARRWTKLFGGAIKLGKVETEGLQTRWRIDATLPTDPNGLDPHRDGSKAAAVRTDYVVLEWDDLVRQRMAAPTIWRVARAMAAFTTALAAGSMTRMAALARIPTVVTFYPFVMAFGYAALALLAMFGAPILLGASVGTAPLWFAPIGALLAWLVFRVADMTDEKTFALYLVDLYSYCHRLAADATPELDARIDAFADIVAAAAKNPDYDEVLVVGHSGGGQLAASAVARALDQLPAPNRRRPDDGPAIALLTLGQFLSAQMQLRPGLRQRAEYRSIARSDRLTWVDVSALADAVCYALCDPLAEGRDTLPSTERRAGPKVVSAAFQQTMTPESFAAVKRNHFRRHFQYLYVFEKPGVFDYFRITCGRQTLAQRFADVKSNKRAPKVAAEVAPASQSTGVGASKVREAAA